MGDGVGVAGKAFRPDRAEPLRVDRLGDCAGRLQQPSGLKRVDLMAGHAAETGGGDDLARPTASAAVELRHQRPHRLVSPLADRSSWNCGASYQ